MASVSRMPLRGRGASDAIAACYLMLAAARMLLALDIGNTNLAIGLFDLDGAGSPAALRADWRLETRASRTGDEYAALLSELFRLAALELGAVKAAIVSSVVPPALFPIEQLCRKH